MSKTTLNLVVAACNNRGIGKQGKLPWSIRKDMDFFKKITTETKNEDKKNVVIMGRKTWFSIPEKFRPLPKRINIILSREMNEAPDEVYVCRSLCEAITMVNTDLAEKVENICIIGGSSVYKEAMESDHNCRIFLTRILADFDCDTFLPEFDENHYKIVDNFPGVPEGKQTEKDIDFVFEVYEKILNDGKCDFNVMAAMCSNRGIGIDNKLPWPYLEKDYRYYMEKCSPILKDKKTVIIKGRLTWYSTGDGEKSNPGFLNVVVTNSKFEELKADPHVYNVAKDFDEALMLGNALIQSGQCERVWVLGGQRLYEIAVKHPCCKRIYLTEIYKEFPSDTFFPHIPSNFKEVSGKEEGVDPEMQEDNGIQFQFKIYERTTP